MVCLFFFKQKTSYDMRISDWSSDLCSSDLAHHQCAAQRAADDLVRLVESQMLEGDDTLCRARLAVAQFDDPRPGADRVARKRSEERRVGKRVSVRVDHGGRRIIIKKIT